MSPVAGLGWLGGLPTTFLLAPFHWDNFTGSGPKRGPDGTLALTLPIGKAKMAGIAASDIEAATYGMFKKGRELIIWLSGEKNAARIPRQ